MSVSNITRPRKEQGFTFIELLVVILVIGILAAIALPAFLGQSSKAKDASVKSNLRNAWTAVDACYTQESDYRDCLDAAKEAGLPGPSVTATAENGPLTIEETSSSGNTFKLVHDPGSGVERTCTDGANGKGSCPAGGGEW